MNGRSDRNVTLAVAGEGHIRAQFQALGGPCEILIDAQDGPRVRESIATVAGEAWRIEDKFSRFKTSGVVHQINSANGEVVDLDKESAGLIDYADLCYRLSNGAFDITSGVLRRVWRFDGSRKVPSRKDVERVLPFVGWDKVQWHAPNLRLRCGMEIDLGGIGKEYAVDRAAMQLVSLGFTAALVNFGGDLRATGPRMNGEAWMVGIDNPRDTGRDCISARPIAAGALATSGDARRFIVTRGKRYGHILNPQTGWPVSGAPRSVTVQAPTCLEAGMLATLGILKGADAGRFLESQSASHFIVW